MKIFIPLALVLALSGCEFFRSVNKEDVRNAVEVAAVEVIRTLNEKGFDPVQLSDKEVALAKSACRIVGKMVVEGVVKDPTDKVELLALMESVCRVLGVGLSTTVVDEEEAVVVDG